MIIPGLSIPTPQQPIVEGSPLMVAQVWWRFFQALLNRTQASIPYDVANGLVAAGATQGTAFKMSADWNVFATVAANTGGLLPNFGQGFNTWVWNSGANPLKVYPPVGCQIDALGANVAYVLAAGKAQLFNQVTATQFLSFQPG